MAHWVGLLILSLISFWGLAFFQSRLWIASLVFVLLLGLWQLDALGLLNVDAIGSQIARSQATETLIASKADVFITLWCLLALFILVFNFTLIRRYVITFFLFKKFKEALPPMSNTEREAIEAGDIWWEAELFRGRPNWQKFHQIPKPMLTNEEIHFLNHEVEHLCNMINEWDITHATLDLPPQAWDYLKNAGFFGMIIPKQYGGLGFSPFANSTIVQKIATHSLTAAITTMVPNSLGPGELLLHYGTETQKQHYLPRLAKGLDIPCFALTGPEAGSDAGSIKDTGVVCYGEFEGKEVLGMKLSWDKRYITLAPVADVLGLAFKLKDPEKLLGEKEDLGITLCLLPTKHPGVEIGTRHFPLNQPFMNGPTRGKDVFVPIEWIIGGPAMAGKGWRMLVESLSAGRGISLPALSTAAVKLCYRTVGAYAKIRKQFGVSIGQFEGVQASMASIAGLTYLTEALRIFTIAGLNGQRRPAITTAIAKYHMTEMSRKTVNDAMDIHAGKAIMLGPKNYLARAYESLPISITVEGANILTRNLIIFGQGAIRCHPYLQQEMTALNNPNRQLGLKDFDQTLFKHLGYSLSNMVRGFTHALTGGVFIKAPFVPFRRYYQHITRLSVALAFVADVTLFMLGGQLKRRERLSARLGDVLSYLFLSSAVLKYYREFGDKPDIMHVNWALQTCLHRAQNAFYDFSKNFPIPFIGFLMRRWIFPYGSVFTAPSDKLEHRMALMMMYPSLFRERLTRYCYLGTHENSAIKPLETAFNQVNTFDTILAKIEAVIKKGEFSKNLKTESKIKKALALGGITAEEVAWLNEFEKECLEIIQVDEFTEDQFLGK